MALGMYNRTPANRVGGVSSYNAKYDMYASLTLTMDIGVQYACRYECASEMHAEMDLWWGYDAIYQLQEELEAQSTLTAWVNMLYTMGAALTASMIPALDAKYSMLTTLTAKMTGYVMVKPVWGPLMAALTMEVNSVQTQQIIMTLEDLVIPPGSTVVIDCENYTITLDGVNIIDRYRGDWFYITPQLQGVDVQSGTSGNLRASILYREKYL